MENESLINFSGTSAEGNYNNLLKNSTWAQPSGLSIGKFKNSLEVFVADSESSAIWAIDLDNLDNVRSVVGGDENPRNLFAFGDIDGYST